MACALGLRVLSLFAFGARLLALGVGGFLAALLLLAFSGSSVLALAGALRARLLRVLAVARLVLRSAAVRLAHLGKQVGHGVAQLGDQARILLGSGAIRLAAGRRARLLCVFRSLGTVGPAIAGGSVHS